MITQWILLLLLLPGWLLPSGVSVPLCGCQFSLSETRSCCVPVETHSSCCVPVETHSCCASEDETDSCCASEDETDSTGTSVQREGECHCSVDAPAHEPARVQPLTETSVLFALPLEVVQVSSTVPATSISRALHPDRPRGPSPGRPNPAPLRL